MSELGASEASRGDDGFEGGEGGEGAQRAADPVSGIHRAIKGPTCLESLWLAVIRVLSLVTVVFTVGAAWGGRGGAAGAARHGAFRLRGGAQAFRAKPVLSTAVVLATASFTMAVLSLLSEWYIFETGKVAGTAVLGTFTLGSVRLCTTVEEGANLRERTDANRTSTFGECVSKNKRTCVLVEMPDLAEELTFLREISVAAGVFTFFTAGLGALALYLTVLVRTGNLFNGVPEQLWFLRQPRVVALVHVAVAFWAMVAFASYADGFNQNFSFPTTQDVFPQLGGYSVSSERFGAGFAFMVLIWMLGALLGALVYFCHDERNQLVFAAAVGGDRALDGGEDDTGFPGSGRGGPSGAGFGIGGGGGGKGDEDDIDPDDFINDPYGNGHRVRGVSHWEAEHGVSSAPRAPGDAGVVSRPNPLALLSETEVDAAAGAAPAPAASAAALPARNPFSGAGVHWDGATMAAHGPGFASPDGGGGGAGGARGRNPFGSPTDLHVSVAASSASTAAGGDGQGVSAAAPGSAEPPPAGLTRSVTNPFAFAASVHQQVVDGARVVDHADAVDSDSDGADSPDV